MSTEETCLSEDLLWMMITCGFIFRLPSRLDMKLLLQEPFVHWTNYRDKQNARHITTTIQCMGRLNAKHMNLRTAARSTTSTIIYLENLPLQASLSADHQTTRDFQLLRKKPQHKIDEPSHLNLLKHMCKRLRSVGSHVEKRSIS